MLYYILSIVKKERKVKVGALKIMALKRYKKIYYFNVLIEKKLLDK